MNSLQAIVIVNIVAFFAIVCGIKLFDLGSSLADIIRKYGIFLGIILAVVTIVCFLLPNAAQTIKDGQVGLPFIASFLVVVVVDSIFRQIRKKITEPKKQKRARVAKSQVFGLYALEIINSALTGTMIGFSFIFDFTSGMLFLCALVLYQIMDKVHLIVRLQEAGFNRGKYIAATVTSLIIVPAVACVTSVLLHENYMHLGALIAIAAGYLGGISLGRLMPVVAKMRQKR